MGPNAATSRSGSGAPLLLILVVTLGGAVGPWVPRHAAAQDRCDTVTGDELRALRTSLEEQASLRDSIQRILTEAGAYDSTGALLVWTDDEEKKTRMALVNLDPPRSAYYRIRGLLAGHFSGKSARRRNVTVDLDAPDVAIEGDSARRCGCGVPEDAADRQLREYMKRAVQQHPDFDLQAFDAEGTVSVFVDWQGKVLHAVLADSTGDDWLDRVIPPLAREMEFEPASVDGTPRGGWLSRDFRFRSTVR